mmetsp:Transcript_16024/g.55699  ORF Transcript_16024/g.55699 Transcript_16024/m.55699 type:complete len:211 (+) Transcript_16024:954-1586(+)
MAAVCNKPKMPKQWSPCKCVSKMASSREARSIVLTRKWCCVPSPQSTMMAAPELSSTASEDMFRCPGTGTAEPVPRKRTRSMRTSSGAAWLPCARRCDAMALGPLRPKPAAPRPPRRRMRRGGRARTRRRTRGAAKRPEPAVSAQPQPKQPARGPCPSTGAEGPCECCRRGAGAAEEEETEGEGGEKGGAAFGGRPGGQRPRAVGTRLIA